MHNMSLANCTINSQERKLKNVTSKDVIIKSLVKENNLVINKFGQRKNTEPNTKIIQRSFLNENSKL